MNRTSIGLAGLACLLLAACYSSEDGVRDGISDADADTEEVSEDCARDPLICDAIYIPIVTFTFIDTSTGMLYCDLATVGYSSPRCGYEHEAPCGCRDGEMTLYPDYPHSDYMGCVLDPPAGETSTITVSAPGYRVFTQEVTLPYECHPRVHIDVMLEPL